jgi:hypothetical protein
VIAKQYIKWQSPPEQGAGRTCIAAAAEAEAEIEENRLRCLHISRSWWYRDAPESFLPSVHLAASGVGLQSSLEALRAQPCLAPCTYLIILRRPRPKTAQ